ncbi:MAG: enoyl-CoA hydratase-related protein, partial [Nitriliruptoraceae bacterium]
TVVIDRPARRNAMTMPMYAQLVDACAQADGDADVLAMVITGTAHAFCAGTDIATFLAVTNGDQGLAYERRITEIVHRLEAVTVPTIAAIAGACMGGGLLMAAACDLRLATSSARFGAPMAATVGNTLSADSLDLLVDRLGTANVQRMLIGAEVLGADEFASSGFVRVVDNVNAEVAAVTASLRDSAAQTVVAAKQALSQRRAARLAALPSDDDEVRKVYDHPDFHARIRAFLDR